MDVSISWDTASGQSYDLRSGTNLVSEAWATVYTNVTGTGGEVTVDISVVDAAEFYKGTSE